VQQGRHDRLDVEAVRMELVAALPPELMGMLDPAVRGAAPLLRSVADDSDVPDAAVPFGFFLELLAAPLPAGQGLPAAGKGLPAPPLAFSAPATAVATQPGPTALPFMEAAVAAGLRLEGAASFASMSTPMAPTAGPPGPTLSLTPAAFSNVAPESAALPAVLAEPLTPPGVVRDLPAAPFGADALTTDPALELQAPPTLREAFGATPEPRLRPPPVDARAAKAAPPAPGGDMCSAAPPAEVAAPVLRVVQRDGSNFTLRPVAAIDAASAAPTDWLPQAAGQPSTHAATAPHTMSAPAQPSLDLNAPDWHEAFASRVQWLIDHRVGEAHIKLNPPELGALDVKISLVDDQTFVHVTASSAGARDELAQSLPRLRELLSASGLELGGASVESGRDGRHEAGGYAVQARGAGLDRDLPSPGQDERSPAAQRRMAGRIDLFA
jgi:flagellar hook-length control protein FliK